MNNRGQALVEFIIILPIFLLLIISVIDFGNIISKKYALENDIDTINDMYKLNDTNKINTYIINKGLSIDYKSDEEFTTIKLSKEVKVTSPVLIVILGKNYTISSEKTIYEDQHE